MLSEAWASRLFTKKRTGIGVVCDVPIKDACVSSESLMALGDQITVLLRLPEPAASRQAATLFILIAVMLDVLSFVHGEAHRPYKRRELFVHLLASFIRQGVRSAVLAHRHR